MMFTSHYTDFPTYGAHSQRYFHFLRFYACWKSTLQKVFTYMHTHGYTYTHARMNTQNQSATSETNTSYFKGKRFLLQSASLLAFPLYSPVGTDLCPMKCFMYICMHNSMLSSLLYLDSHLTT